MGLDANYMLLDEALKLAKKYYDKETLAHARRVLHYVMNDRAIPLRYIGDCRCLAIMHDIVEDTDYTPVGLPKNFTKALDLLTKPKDMSYDDYCKRINDAKNTAYGRCAYWVKLADIKDHLSLTSTLTPRLKEKYLSGLKYLL